MPGFVKYNPNPINKRVGDCVIRAISKATGQSWEETYTGICLKGFELCDMPSSNYVWGEYLKDKGFHRQLAPDGITVEQFAREYPRGIYVLAISGYVVCVVDSEWWDTWDSKDEVALYYWERKER